MIHAHSETSLLTVYSCAGKGLTQFMKSGYDFSNLSLYFLQINIIQIVLEIYLWLCLELCMTEDWIIGLGGEMHSLKALLVNTAFQYNKHSTNTA